MKDYPISLNRAVNCMTPTWKRYPGKGSEEFYKKWGFHYEDAWNLDASASYFILTRLVQLRDTCCGYPCELHEHYRELYADEDEADRRAIAMYHTILNKMIRGFHLYLTVNFPDKKQQKIIDRAWRLFAEWAPTLWD